MARESTVKHAVNHSGGVGGEAPARGAAYTERRKKGGIYLFTTEREAADESKRDAPQSVREGTRKEKKEGRSVD